MKDVYAFDIYDRRTGDQIDERTIDEAIKNHINGIDDAALATYDETQKLDMLHEAGFSIRPLSFIDTCRHSGPFQSGDEVNPLEEHVQVDFNYPDETVNFDLYMEQYDDKKYLILQFFPKQGKFQSILRRLFDTDGNEKVFEACPHCGEEVIIDAKEKVQQPCPKCGELIRACCLCPVDKDCKNCG